MTPSSVVRKIIGKKRRYFGLLVIAAVSACTVTIPIGGPGGDEAIVISFGLGSSGIFIVMRDVPVANSARVSNLDIPANAPSAAALQLRDTDVTVTPLNAGRETSPASATEGLLSIRVRIADAASGDPCGEGTDLGAFRATVSGGTVTVTTDSLELPSSAAAQVLVGDFTMCIELEADFDGEVTLSQISFFFGTPQGQEGGEDASRADDGAGGGGDNDGQAGVAPDGGDDGTVAGGDGNADDGGTGGDTGGDAGNGGSSDGTETGGTPEDGDTDDPPDAGNFIEAAIIHRGAGGFLADPTVDLPADAAFNVSESGSVKTSVRIPRVTKDGSKVWFAAQDGNGFVTPQLFCINADGSGIQEFALPSDLVLLPSELWPSADGETCALIIDACGSFGGISGCSGFAFTKSVILLANRATGSVTTLFDARNLDSGEDDYLNLQMTDDGRTIFFKGWDTGIIYSLPNTGGTPATFLTPSVFTRADSTPLEPMRFRINGSASALLAVVRFEGPDNTFPRDLYLWTPAGVTAVTNTGDAYTKNDVHWTDLGVTDDARYVAYMRSNSSEGRSHIHLLDRSTGTTATLSTIQSLGADHPLLLDSAGTILFGSHGLAIPYGNTESLPALMTLDGSSALEYQDAWIKNTAVFSSMSGGGGMLVGRWDNGSFGNPDRLYAWWPGASSFRTGPSIAGASYSLDGAAATLTVRVTVDGPHTSVRLFGFKNGIESFYELGGDSDVDPFFTERFGQDMPATDDPTVYEYTVDLGGLTLDSTFRVRIGVGDNEARNSTYVDFRPVPVEGETEDVTGDGVPD